MFPVLTTATVLSSATPYWKRMSNLLLFIVIATFLLVAPSLGKFRFIWTEVCVGWFVGKAG